jgi:hypothetical protein
MIITNFLLPGLKKVMMISMFDLNYNQGRTIVYKLYFTDSG